MSINRLWIVLVLLACSPLSACTISLGEVFANIAATVKIQEDTIYQNSFFPRFGWLMVRKHPKGVILWSHADLQQYQYDRVPGALGAIILETPDKRFVFEMIFNRDGSANLQLIPMEFSFPQQRPQNSITISAEQLNDETLNLIVCIYAFRDADPVIFFLKKSKRS